jgi:hypothetical protein
MDAEGVRSPAGTRGGPNATDLGRITRPEGAGGDRPSGDGWIPGHLADWRGSTVAESRPLVDEAAVSAGRDPADVDTVYNVSGHITSLPLAETRDDEGRWIGGGAEQWVDELTFAVLEHDAAAFNYLVPPGDFFSDTTLNLWVREVAPAVREAVSRGRPERGIPEQGEVPVRRCGITYTWSMPTPVGPVSPDPNDPDLWDWDGDDDDFPRRPQPWRLLLIGIIVLGLVLLLVVSVL